MNPRKARFSATSAPSGTPAGPAQLLCGSWYTLQHLQPKLHLFSASSPSPQPLAGSPPLSSFLWSLAGRSPPALYPGCGGGGGLPRLPESALPAFIRVAPAAGRAWVAAPGAWLWSCSATGQRSYMVRNSWAWASGRPGSFPQCGRWRSHEPVSALAPSSVPRGQSSCLHPPHGDGGAGRSQ